MKGKLLVKAVRKAVVICTVGLVLLFSASYASAGNIVANGSFEVPGVPFGGFCAFNDSGSFSCSDGVFRPPIPGWFGFANDPSCFPFGFPIWGIEIQNQCCGLSDSGNQHVELDSFCPSGMFQDLPTTPGQLYDLSFAYSPRPCVSDNRIDVKWNGTEIANLDGFVCPGGTVWEVHDITCLSASEASTTRLQFEDASVPDTVGGYIDSVSAMAHTETGCVSTTATVDPTATVADDATVGPGAVIEAGATVDSGASIGAEAQVLTEAAIGTDTVVGESAVVGARTVVNQESTVMPEAEIGRDSKIGKNAIIGPQTSMESSVTVGANTMVGVEGDMAETTVVRPNVVMGKGAKVYRGVELESGVTIDAEAEVGFAEKPAAEGLLADLVVAEYITVVEQDAFVGTGSIIWKGAKIGTRGRIGPRAEVNPGAMLEEDVAMGADSEVGNEATIRARVRVGKGATVGDRADVGQDTTMGAGSLVGADCCVPPGTPISANDTTTYATGSPSCTCPAAGL